jgi:hypothetical protein
MKTLAIGYRLFAQRHSRSDDRIAMLGQPASEIMVVDGFKNLEHLGQ